MVACEDNGMQRVSFFVGFIFFLLSHRNHRTIKWGRGETKTVVEVIAQPETYIFRVKIMRENLLQSWMSQFCL